MKEPVADDNELFFFKYNLTFIYHLLSLALYILLFIIYVTYGYRVVWDFDIPYTEEKMCILKQSKTNNIQR